MNEAISFKQVANEIKDSALSSFLADNLKFLLSIADVLFQFAEYVVKVSKTFQLYQTVTIFLEFLVRSYGIIEENKQPKADEDRIIKQLFTLCQKIQLLIAKLLAPIDEPCFYFQHLDAIEEFNCFKEGKYHFLDFHFIILNLLYILQ